MFTLRAYGGVIAKASVELTDDGYFSDFQMPEVLVDLRLQLTHLLQRAFSKQGEVARMLAQDFVAVGFEDALHSPHLLDGLIKFFGCINQSAILKRAIFASLRLSAFALIQLRFPD